MLVPARWHQICMVNLCKAHYPMGSHDRLPLDKDFSMIMLNQWKGSLRMKRRRLSSFRPAIDDRFCEADTLPRNARVDVKMPSPVSPRQL